MNRSQKPKKGRRWWLPLVCIVLLVAGGGLLWRSLDNPVAKEEPETELAPPPPAPEPPPTPPTVEAEPARARQPIFDRNMAPLAITFKLGSVYLRPLELQEGQQAVDHLAKILDLAPDKVKADLRTERGLFWLKRNLDPETARKIADSKYSGVYLVDEFLRYYPFHDHAAHVVGFVKEEQGLAGAEYFYDTILSGERTLASQYLNLPGINTAELPANGAAAVLSVDIDLQILLEKKLLHLQQQTEAETAGAVVIDATDGEILAMANLPGYDPNLYWQAAGAAHQNKVLSAPLPVAGINAFIKAAAELAAGNLPPEKVERETDAERIISPRAIKIPKGDVAVPAVQESQVWQPGIHLSPPFQWAMTFTQGPDELTDFCGKLGITAPGTGLGDTRVDEGAKPAATAPPRLEDDAFRAYPLQLLAAFAQLTNGGNAISPHLLRGLWLGEEETFQPIAFPAPTGIGPKASADFVAFVEALLPPGPEEALVLEAIKTTVRLAGITGVKAADDGPARTIENAIRFSSTALAFGRQGEHQLALILITAGANFNLALPSPVRKAAAEIISQGQGLMAKRWGGVINTPKLESNAQLYQQWIQSQTTDAPAAISSMVTMEMPDVVGMSLRKAMQAMQGYNLKVSVQGSGRVIRQTPKAGVRLQPTDEAKLELGMDK
jgi:cell division protein FtsI (penicillin-binding protein 3)